MPRPAAELRAEAVGSGWFDGPHLQYVGDGYTIPWETGLYISPVFGGTLSAWKSYLDTYYREPSRLHDWLYTPYGPGLIGATQEESDLALREEMLAEGIDAAQAELVYQACHLGGAPWYGRSIVGYVQPIRPVGGNNITPTAVGAGVNMATFKVMMVFQNTTSGLASVEPIGYTIVPRTGGWSESYYQIGGNTGDILRQAKGPRTDGYQPILQARATLLPITARILGLRIYESAGGRGQFFPAAYPGTWSLGDVPSMALLCATTSAGTPTVRRFTMRGIPDNQVVAGEFAPTSLFATELRAYFDSLYGTSFLGRDPVAEQAIFDVSNAGLVSCEVPIVYTGGQIVTVSQTLDSDGRRRSGRFQVSATGPLSNQLTLAGWTHGPCTGGKLSIPTKSLWQVQPGATSAVRITNHKIGRPFAGYRGRNSVRSR